MDQLRELDWGRATYPPADIDKDGTVDVVDLAILLSHWTADSEPAVVRYEVDPDAPESEVEVIQEGIVAAQDYLNQYLGGDVTPAIKSTIWVRIVATGEGNDGACCTAFAIGEDGESLIRPFFDVRHPGWVNRPTFVSWSPSRGPQGQRATRVHA